MNQPKTVFVSGSTKGIGMAAAEALLAEGYLVAGNSRAEHWDIPESWRNRQNFMYVSGDVTQEEDVADIFRRVISEYGRIDILVNNVGRSNKKTFLSAGKKDFEDMFAINMLGAALCTKHALKSMVRHRFGRVINISSIAGTNGMPMEVYYSSAKAALLGFTKAVSKEYSRKGITCNAVAPGIIDTGILKDDSVLADIPAQRFGRPEDVSGLICFLASERASYITGQLIKVDGGLYT